MEIFRKTSFKSSAEPVFRLASGKLSRFYVDSKQALSDPEARSLIGELIFDLVKNESFDSVGGMELGAYPIATCVSDKIYRETGKSVRAFVIRKEQKKHGVTAWTAGDARKGDRALIVEDVVTTGDSTVKAIRRARESGLHVDRVVALVDRQEEDGRKNIEAENVTFSALFTLAELEELDDASGLAKRQSGGAVVAR
jgi:orotate phosphoribosyltransferase